MYNLLIIEEDLKFALKISNYISKHFHNIRICSISTTEKEAQDMINSNISDFIILDLDLIKISINVILASLRATKKDYSKSLITIKNNDLVPPIIVNSIYFSSHYNRKFEIYKLRSLVQNLLNKKNESLEEKIYNELHKINFNFNYIGTKYLVDCISICRTLVNNISEINTINLKTNVFPIIAKKYKTTINCVKTNINRATTNMYYDCNEQYLNEYFNNYSDSKPTLKILIYTVLSKF